MADTGSPFNIPYVEPTDLVRDYPAASEDLADAIADQFGLGYQYVGTRYYTSSGTFAKADPFGDSSFDGAKMRAIRVRVQGAGGGGGGSGTDNAAGAGGGGGAYTEGLITNIAGLATSETVTVGGPGTAGAAGNNNGSAGGSSSFGTLAVAGGGGGGQSGAGSFVANNGGTVATSAGLAIPGGPGMNRVSLNARSTGSGGHSFLGFGAGSLSIATTFSAGTIAGGFGGGGGGGVRVTTTSAGGQDGTVGVVIIDVFA